MERALKERLVGAVVLVAVGVWVIPLFLDGPEQHPGEPSPARPLTLPVPAQASRQPALRTQTIKINSGPNGGIDGSKATLAKEARKTVSPSPKPVTVSRPSSPKPTTVKTTPPAATKTGTDWVVQLGSFGSEANAKRLAKQVDALGWSVRVRPFKKDGKTMHRVRVGPSPTRSKAETVAAELAQRGFRGQVMSAES